MNGWTLNAIEPDGTTEYVCGDFAFYERPRYRRAATPRASTHTPVENRGAQALAKQAPPDPDLARNEIPDILRRNREHW